MEYFQLQEDTMVYYLTASSFPQGILAAHQALHEIVPFSEKRNYYGISFPDKNGIIAYKAAATALSEEEAASWELPAFVLKKGRYAVMAIKDYTQHLPAIQACFDELLQLPELDPQGACVEWYINNRDMKCMVRMLG